MAELMFEQYKVPAFYLCKSAVLSAYPVVQPLAIYCVCVCLCVCVCVCLRVCVCVCVKERRKLELTV